MVIEYGGGSSKLWVFYRKMFWEEIKEFKECDRWLDIIMVFTCKGWDNWWDI